MAMRRRAVVGQLLLWTAALQGLAGRDAAPCDDRLAPAPGQLGYRSRDGGRRCEGLYRSPIAGSALELVSLHQGALRFTLNPKVRLRLRPVASEARLKETAIRVRAVALPVRTYYRLDGIVAGNAALEWPVDAVLLPARLADSQIGVFGWFDGSVDTERVFVPVRVASEAAAAPSSTTTTMTVRSTAEAERVLWRWYAEPHAGDLPPWEVAATAVLGGGAVSIRLPDGPELVMTVDVTAKSVGSDRWSSLRTRVLRPASR